MTVLELLELPESNPVDAWVDEKLDGLSVCGRARHP